MEDMKAYILTIFATALIMTVVDILAPNGATARHLKLLGTLVFVCVLISPTVSLAQKLQDFANGEWETKFEGEIEDHYSSELQNALDDASFAYFEEMLAQTICKEFGIDAENLRVRVDWGGKGDSLRPQKVTVILSGKAIWKDPAKMEEFVSSLLGCDCASAIE